MGSPPLFITTRYIAWDDSINRMRVFVVWADDPIDEEATQIVTEPGPELAMMADLPDVDLPRAASMPNAVPPGALTTLLQLLGAHNALVASHNTLLARLRAAGLMET